MGINDGASKLCKANMKYGLAQLHLIQEKYGFEPTASFISSPDETISRNSYRWNSGFGYGGRIDWGKGNDDIIFLNPKPNCCGILVGGLKEEPTVYDIIKRIDEIKKENLYIDDVLIDWDFGKANHFINCFETKNLSDMDLPPYIFFIHGSAPELRDDEHGIGLYVDKSKVLKDLAKEENTIFGNQYILLDSNVKEYCKFHKKAIEFSSKKRELVAERLFGPNYQKICNQTHQFLKDSNSLFLGCNCTDLNNDVIKENIFPTALRADINAYLFRGKKNLSKTTIINQGFHERAESLGILKRLENANILPHGGGYTFPDIKKVQKVIEYMDQRYFVCELRTSVERLKIIRDVSTLQFAYRGRDIVFKTLQLDLGDIIARLNPRFSLKL